MKILKILGKDESSIEYVKDRPGHDRRYAVNWSKLEKLGWKPEYELDYWLEKTVQWYKDNREWWGRVKSGEYLKYYETVYGARKV